MDAPNTYIEAALVHADEEADLRKQVVELIRAVVTDELNKIMQNQPGTSPIVQQLLYQNRGIIESMALQAIKKQWVQNTPNIYIS